MKYQAIVWDMDGTLLDTLEDITNSVNHTLKAYGYPTKTLEQVRRAVGNGMPLLIRRVLPESCGQSDCETVLQAFKAHYGLHCQDMTKPYQGIMELLERARRAGVKMAIVSNKADFAVKKLTDEYFPGLIPVAIGENEAAGVRKKPAPDTVYTALAQLGIDKDRAVYIGDSEVDVATAQNAGMDGIAVTWGFRTEEQLRQSGAVCLIDTTDQLAVYLGI